MKNDAGRFSEEALLTISKLVVKCAELSTIIVEICTASVELPQFPDLYHPLGMLQRSGQLAYPQYSSSQQLYSRGM